MRIQQTSAPTGAVVTGLDLKNLSRAEECDLYRAFLQYGVLVFKGLNTDLAGHLALSNLFGEPDLHPIEALRLKEEPKLIMLAANGGKPVSADDPDADKMIGLIPWHTDLMYTDTPNRGGLLRAITIPEKGGNTGWIDTAGVYEALPYWVKRKVQGLQIIHSYERTHRSQNMVGGSADLFREVLHPLVYVHPEIGLPVLNISPSTAEEIIGVAPQEATELLQYLIDFATREERAYVHAWEPGDIVLWDNWRTMHRAYGHLKRYPRVVHRSTLKSDMRLGRWIENKNARPRYAAE
jgi:taurine dioxygenase